ncbi:endolytic transglycosylase MltG [Geobacter pelophilus]|uniref:Endolytic murein transglycosylase n=1 Tax=Geoanaerobacter pelophilus TaxID=60036 RepID=A0AAW4L4W5_9BACT|nr:endolytic transglycosylase MltG [Geoanaerobacter pelophilus]
MRPALGRLFPQQYRKPVVSAIVASALVAMVAVSCLMLPPGDGSNVQLVDCGKGAPLARAAAEMKRKGVIRSATLLVVLARIKGIDGQVQAGTYQLNDGMSLSEILRKMVAGEIYANRFAVPEGYSIYQLAELLESRRIHPKVDFLAACSDKGVMQEFGIPGNTVEGYLFPATYNIMPNMKPVDTVRMMLRQFEKACGQLSPQLARGSARHRLVTMASIVEKEAVDPKERPLIASVFYNRLRKGMRLQSDPTAVYGVRPFAGKVSGDDVHRLSPYNTYRIKGLPPGPIGNPSAGAIQAAMKPQTSPYYYFVAKRDGTHFFSTTLDQHNIAVTKYLKNKGRNISSSGDVPGLRNDHPNFTDGR